MNDIDVIIDTIEVDTDSINEMCDLQNIFADINKQIQDTFYIPLFPEIIPPSDPKHSYE